MVKVSLKGGGDAEVDIVSLEELYRYHRLAHDHGVRIVVWFHWPNKPKMEFPTTVLDAQKTFGALYSSDHFKED